VVEQIERGIEKPLPLLTGFMGVNVGSGYDDLKTFTIEI